MTNRNHVYLLDTSGAAAPPRSNGELVFNEPWEGRAFGMVMSLHNTGLFSWEEFRQHLITRIRDHQTLPGVNSQWGYYRCWLAALEQVLVEKQLLDSDELEQLLRTFETRPAGHDH